MDAVEETKDDDSNEENVAPDSASAILEWVPAFLWAVACDKVTGCTFQLADSAIVKMWCTTVWAHCFCPLIDPCMPQQLEGTLQAPPCMDNLDLCLGALTASLEWMAQLQEERPRTNYPGNDSVRFRAADDL